MSSTDSANTAAKNAGHLAQRAIGLTQQTLEKHNVAARLQAEKSKILTSATESYERNTNRNATIDTTILKYSAIATVGAVAISTAPALVVGVAVGGVLAGAVAAKKSAAAAKYDEMSGRSFEADSAAIRTEVGKGVLRGTELAGEFQLGMRDEALLASKQ